MKVHIRQNGVDLPSVQHEGQRWVLVPPEGEYEIVLYNDSHNRRLAVVTVDGVSVVDASDGSREGTGYVLEPWQSFPIEGWRRSGQKAAKFRFTPNGDSYVAQMGKGTRNTGVVAVAVFDEKPKPVVLPPPVVIREPPIIIDPWPWPWVRPLPYPYPRPPHLVRHGPLQHHDFGRERDVPAGGSGQSGGLLGFPEPGGGFLLEPEPLPQHGAWQRRVDGADGRGDWLRP